MKSWVNKDLRYVFKVLNGNNHYFHIVYQSEDVKLCLCHDL